MRKHYERMLRDTENRVRYSLRVQVKQEGEKYGGFLDENGIVHSKYAIYRATSAIAAYCNKDSVYYHDAAVFRMVKDALTYVIRCQHENGLFDLITCNFFSAPDTAFCVKRIMPFLKYLHKNRGTAEEEELYQALYTIAKRGAAGLLKGGFHTPNHRWAIASMLMECGEFFGDTAMKGQADQYLLEGIDCNEDGEYAEKSAGNYNRVNNDAMIIMGHVSGERKYFEYAVRNLRMMLTYIEPDGSIFTANSTRQDNGKLIYPKDYYTEYLEMGILMEEPEFLDMANYIFELVEEKGITSPDQIIHYMNHPEWKDFEHEGIWRQPEFRCLYKESGIARIHRKSFTYTLMQGKSGFLHFASRSMKLEVKLGASFCEHRAFCPEELRTDAEGEARLSQVMRGWYYLPFKEKPSTSDWWKMDNEKREKLLGPDLEFSVKVKEVAKGIELYVKTSGVEGAPLRLEIAVAGAKFIGGRQFDMETIPGGSMVLKEGEALLTNGIDSLKIGPGFGQHLFTAGKFGSESRSSHAFTVYCTDTTPFERVIRIQTGEEVR